MGQLNFHCLIQSMDKLVRTLAPLLSEDVLLVVDVMELFLVHAVG